MAGRADLAIYQGDDYAATVTVSNPDGTAANLAGYVAIRGEPGPGPVEEAIAESDGLQAWYAKEPLLDLQVRADAGGNGGSRTRGKCVGFDGKSFARRVEESRGLHQVAPGPGGARGMEDVAAAFQPHAAVTFGGGAHFLRRVVPG